MRSRLYQKERRNRIASYVKDRINAKRDFLSAITADSPRAVGDALEKIVGDQFENILGDWCTDYSNDFARRAMADIAFTDKDGFYHITDIKTHRIDTSFNMPQLTSVERLARLYEDDKNVFSVLMVKYEIDGLKVRARDVIFAPIEYLDWKCLTIGALGWGQIQIRNSNDILLRDSYSRKKWMIEFCDAVLSFYPKEIGKIRNRIERFERVKEVWESREDV